MTPRLLCFGEMLVRLTAPPGELLLQTPQLSAHIGGAEANVAIAVSRLGGSAAMATVLPDNPIGRAARDELRRHGVDLSGVRFVPGRMGLYFLTPAAVRRASEVIYDRAGSAFALLARGQFDWPTMLSGVEWLHISGITPAVSELAGTEALEAAAAATAAGVKVSFDGNYRAKLWQARGETGAPFLRKLLDHATLAFIDERDIALVLGGSVLPRLEAAGAAFGAFPRLQMLAATTRDASGVESHALGATLHTRAGETRIDPIALPHIVDRIGGGDAFAGGLLFALMDGMEGADALAFALYSAAAKHGQSGDASHASATDIRALMDGKLDVKR